ncbi:FHA domain-containing protein, partial [Actinomyces israelii]
MIGRAPVCAVIVSHPRVSREHLMVEPTPVGWRATCAAGRSMLIDGRWATSAILTRETRIQLVDQFGPLISLTPTGGALGPGGAPVGAVPAAPPRPPTSVAPTGIPGPPGPPTGFPPTAAVPASAGPPANGVSVGPPGPPTGGLPASAASAEPPEPPGPPTGASPPGPPTGASPPGPPTGGLPASAASAPSAASTVMLGSGGASTSGPPGPTGVTSAGGAASGDLAATGEVTISGSGTIGRRPDNSFIVNDPTMSGRHARVDVTPQGAVVTDLGSTNGTFVSGQRVDRYVVTEPTVFGMGSTFVQVDPNGKCSIPVPVN